MPQPKHPSHQKSSSSGSLFSLPPRAGSLAGWALLPLRVFLGVTFLFAGLQKLANPNFFDSNSNSSIQAQLIASARSSPIGFLITHLIEHAVLVGVVISLGEIAVGIGLLLGLWTRIAALGGAALAFGLFLTVSFHASPYYTGADIVFFFGFLPFIVAGAGGVLSLDARIAKRASEELGLGDPTPYAVTFAGVQEFCGNYEQGRCRAQANAPCAPQGCPVLESGHRSIAARGGKPDDVDRRTVVIGTSAAVAAGVIGVVIAGASAGLGRLFGRAPKAQSTTSSFGQTSSTTTTPSGAKPPGQPLGPASQVAVGGAATFTSANGDPGVVIQPSKGKFVAYDAVCPHAGCTVSYSQAGDVLVCPCHGSQFKVSNGDVMTGPSPTGLTPYKVAEGPNGELYIQT